MEKKKRIGNPNMRRGMPSVNPKGKSAGREVLNKQIVDGLKYALDAAHPDGPRGYFLSLAQGSEKDRALFIGMISKAMPSNVDVNVTVDLSEALAEANQRLAAHEAKTIDAVVVDEEEG